MKTLLLSLFPGVDLLGHAFELEWPEACVVRGPDPIFGSLSDIRKFHPTPGRFDGIFGGPPCQVFCPLVNLVRANGGEPRFGNLIPEFERCVSEAGPAWFLMENVPQAPVPVVAGYGLHSFELDNSMLPGPDGDGFGNEQRRLRRFTFGFRDREPANLLNWIDRALFFLPDPARTVSSNVGGFTDGSPNPNRKGRHRAPPLPAGHELTATRKTRRSAALQQPVNNTPEAKGRRPVRAGVVTGSDGGPSVRMGRYKLADALRLQGLPEDFLADCPMTAEGKLKAVANGVPIPMGRALARAVKAAICM